MVDIQETPAVPPTDYGGDERSGYYWAAGTLIFLGWGLGVLLNLGLHMMAPSAGHTVAGIWFGPVMGTYAWSALGFGLMTGVVGIGLVFVARATPKGRFVLPGSDY